MRLGLRVFFGFFLIAGLSSVILLRVVLGEVKPSVREVMEDIMVDTANLLAELATDDLDALPPGAALTDTRFARRVRDYANRPVDVHIWGLRKQTLDFRIYVTNAQGGSSSTRCRAPNRPWAATTPAGTTWPARCAAGMAPGPLRTLTVAM